jgi:hypothetical protein
LSGPRGFIFKPRLPEYVGTGTHGAQKKEEKKTTYLPPTYLPTYLSFFEIFWDFFCLILENVLMVFLGSSCIETAKNAIKKIDGGKSNYLPHLVAICQIYVAFKNSFLWRPLRNSRNFLAVGRPPPSVRQGWGAGTATHGAGKGRRRKCF